MGVPSWAVDRHQLRDLFRTHRETDTDPAVWLALLAEAVLLGLERQEEIMAAIDDLNTAVSNLQSAATNIETALSTAQGANQDPAIAAAAQSVQAVADALNTASAPPAN